MKLYTYTQEQLDKVYAYLVAKPMREVEPLVLILRNPSKIEEATTATPTDAGTSNEETKN